jgi:hypothetical protein
VRVGGRLEIGDWRLEIGDWGLWIYRKGAKVAEGREVFWGEAKRGDAEVAEEDAEGIGKRFFSPPRGQGR